MSECNHDCESCGEKCGERNTESMRVKPREGSRIGKVIAVVSGKGGVGKSSFASMIAITLNKKGYKVGILDGDITGPSIPKLFGLHGNPEMTEFGAYPLKSTNGISVMSMNLLLPNDEEPVVWRGPIISGVIKQFWEEVVWGE